MVIDSWANNQVEPLFGDAGIAIADFGIVVTTGDSITLLRRQ